MDERVVIVGGGVSGLVASYVFGQRGQRAVILEPEAPGGDFLLGGLKYIHHTKPMEAMFGDLGLSWSGYKLKGGILLRGAVEPYPRCFKTMEAPEAQRIQADHFRKTRRTEPGSFGSKAMNDPAAAKGPRSAIRCDFRAMISELAKRANIFKTALQRIDSAHNRVLLSSGKWIGYSRLILTIPLWIIRSVADFYVPQGMAMGLNLVQVMPRRDTYARWDYVYTPYTPADAVHRFSPRGSGYSCEVNGDWAKQEHHAQDDLAFIFEDGFLIEGFKAGVKGHLLELQEQAEWPSNVVPLGRFAEWDPRATTDTTLERAHALAEGWGWQI